MKEYKLQQTILVVEVPEECDLYGVYPFKDNTTKLRYLEEDVSGSSGDPIFKNLTLPEGNWTILGKAFDLTEEDARKIVENNGREWYKNYDGGIYLFKSPLLSWRSFLSTHSIKENYLILIKE